MSTQQEDEVDILARAVSRLSSELATVTLERQRFKNALEHIAANAKADPASWRTAHDALIVTP